MSTTTPLSYQLVTNSPEVASLLRAALTLAFPGGSVVEAADGGGGARIEVEPAADEALSAARAELEQSRGRVAAGDLALKLQHAMNNPLTAVLAEAQLLAMEELPGDAPGAVGRIVENSRRLVALVRELGAAASR